MMKKCETRGVISIGWMDHCRLQQQHPDDYVNAVATSAAIFAIITPSISTRHPKRRKARTFLCHLP